MTSRFEFKMMAAGAALFAAMAVFPALSFSAGQAASSAATSNMASSAQRAGNHLYAISGEVLVTQGKKPAHRVEHDEAIVPGMLIKTGGNSSALLRFEDGQTVAMQADSIFRVREYRYDAKRTGNGSIVFSMFKGGMHFITGQIAQRNKRAFRLLTRNATIETPGADFMVAMADNSIYTSVLKGKIRLTNDAGTEVLSAGQSVVVPTSVSPAAVVAASAVPANTFAALLSMPAEPPLMAASVPAVQTEGSRIYVVSGNVSVARGRNPVHRVTNSEIIAPNTLVSTGDKSSALLRFEDGQVVAMKSNSTFQVRDYRFDAVQPENSNIVFSMFKGGMRFVTGLIGQQRKQAFRLAAPNATIGIRGTDFLVDMADNSMYSQVLNGNISLTNAAGTMVLSAGQTAVVASAGTLASVVPAASIPSGTFSELLAIPLQPSAISAPAPVVTPVSAPAPALPVPAPAPVAAPMPAPAAAVEPVSASAPVPIPAPVPEPARREKSGKGLTAKIGTLGYGAEFDFGKSDRFSARLGINAYTYKHNTNIGPINYDLGFQMQTANLLADWYPFSGHFRTSAGVFYNNSTLDLTGLPTGGNYIINGTAYTSAQIGSLQASMTFNNIAPYFGIGWGNPVAKDKGWGMTSDIGVLFQGKPKTTLTVICATSCPSLATDATAENAQLQDDLGHFKFWPVISFGISYQW